MAMRRSRWWEAALRSKQLPTSRLAADDVFIVSTYVFIVATNTKENMCLLVGRVSKC